MTETWSLNPDYDADAALTDAFSHLLKLDARACRAVAAVADFWRDWMGNAKGNGDEFDHFRAVISAILSDDILAEQMVPLARVRGRYQAAMEALDARIERYERRNKRRPRQPQRKAPVVRLVPKDDDPPPHN